jgi:hypothetical protein
MPETNPKDRIGITKSRVGLVPPTAIAAVAAVMEVGAAKYGPYNWREFPVQRMVYLEAALRHLYADLDGESVDPETGLMHLEHAAAGLLILIDAIRCESHIDNRPFPGRAAAVMGSQAKKPAPAAVEPMTPVRRSGLGWRHICDPKAR